MMIEQGPPPAAVEQLVSGSGAAAGPVTSFPSAFFAGAQPVSALDMMQRVPGFTLKDQQEDVRGFGGAGNVLIDGERPASKDSLSDILRRIPAASVERIELIRSGAQGVDMQGETILANVVRTKGASVTGEAEGALFVHRGGELAPSVMLQGQRRAGDRLIEGSIKAERLLDFAGPDTGRGRRWRVGPNGALVSDSSRRVDEKAFAYGLTAGYQQPLAGGALTLNGSFDAEDGKALVTQNATIPRPEVTIQRGESTEWTGELGGNWERSFGMTELNVVALGRLGVEKELEVEEEGGETEVSDYRGDTAEAILRATVQRTISDQWQVEFGGEGAFNVLDSRNSLEEDGVDIPLPAANVKVSERRGEVFASTVWRPSPTLTLEGGARAEASELKQTGDSRLTKTLTYLKPRLAATWAPTETDELRLRVEREVGQLEFGDFASSTSLDENIVTAGNKDLVPDQRWVFEAAYERKLMGDGAVVLTYRHAEITDVVDRLTFVDAGGEIFDARGNIGDGRQDEVEADFTLPLGGFGLTGGLLKGQLGYRKTSVTDPTTGEKRRFSGEKQFYGEVHFTHDLPAWRFRWGVDLAPAEKEFEYRFDQVRFDRTDLTVDAFAEKGIGAAWRVRLDVKNITNRALYQRRDIFDGPRNVALFDFREYQSVKMGPYAGLTLRRTF